MKKKEKKQKQKQNKTNSIGLSLSLAHPIETIFICGSYLPIRGQLHIPHTQHYII